MIARLLPVALLFSTALAAQEIAPAPVVPAKAPAQAAQDQGLTGSVTDDSSWSETGIDIPAFATPADVPTPASAGSTAALGRAIAEVITADLKNNGLFKPIGPAALPGIQVAEVAQPDFPGWSSRGAEMLVHGAGEAGGAGQRSDDLAPVGFRV